MPRRHPIARRLLAGLFALWFAVVATEGAAAHACPTHDGTVARQAAQADAGGAMAHADHAMPAAHDAQAADAPADGGDHHGGHPCSCPDASCGTSMLALASTHRSTHFGIAVADVRAVFAPATGQRRVPVPYLTPFANGPPAAALA